MSEATASESEQAEAEIAEVVAQLPRGAIGSLQRFVEGTGQREWCEEFAAANFDLAELRQKWGPGRYLINWRKPDPKKPGRLVGAGSTRFQLAAQATEVPGAGGAAPADVRAAEAVTGMVVQHAKQMLDGQQLLQQMQMAVLKNLTEPRRESELMEKILLALVTRTAGSNAPDLGALITLADRLANRTSPTAAMKETLELLETARGLAGEGEGAPAWLTVAAKALDTIGRAVSARPAELPPDGGAPAPAPAPAPVPAGPTPEVSTLPPTAHAIFHFLEPHIPALLRHATLDHDPTTYAGMIFDQLERQYMAEVRDYISRPDFLDLLEAHFPALRGVMIEGSDAGDGTPVLVREWFKDLRDDLVTRIREELEPPPAVEVH